MPRDAAKVGAYWEERRKIIHATNFIIDADKKVTQACFATGPIGRIVAEDALRSVQGAKKKESSGKLITSPDNFADNSNSMLAVDPADVSVGHHADTGSVHSAG